MKIIQSWNQIDKLNEPYKSYLTHTKSMIPSSDAWDFNWGYWIIIERFEELNEPIILNGLTLPSIKDGLFERLELIEERFGVYELVMLLDNDFGIGVLLTAIDVPKQYQALFEKYKLPISA
jgi:hypothetical protein